MARQQLAAGLCRYPQPFRVRTLKALLLLGDCVLGTSLAHRVRTLIHAMSRHGTDQGSLPASRIPPVGARTPIELAVRHGSGDPTQP